MKLLYPKNISKYRNQIMGFSIALIMFCHNSIKPTFLQNIWFSISNLSQVGVDIFFFLSGYGLYYSYKKSKAVWSDDIGNYYDNYKSFIVRRIIRIIPTYIIIVVVWSIFTMLIRMYDIQEIINKYSLITFFTKGIIDEWFISAILFLYAFFPIFFYIGNRKKSLIIFSIILWILSFFVSYYSLLNDISRCFSIFVIRIPVFTIGIYFASLSEIDSEKGYRKDNIIWTFILSALFCFILLYFKPYCYWTYVRFIFCFMAIAICLIFSDNFLNSNKLAKLGTITLELYLLHEKINLISNILFDKLIQNAFLASLISNIFSIIASIIACLLYKYLFQKFIHIRSK